MSDWSLVLTDLDSRNRGFPSEWDGIDITRRYGSYSELSFGLHPEDPVCSEISPGDRAVKVYQDQNLRFHGRIWEPLEFGTEQVLVPCRDPFADFAWRRVQTSISPSQDAGLLAQDRVTQQNSYSPTHLRNGSCDLSVNRTIGVGVGQREDEFIQSLAAMADGFFFFINPVDGVPGTFAELEIRYPDAGTNREEVRFEFGEDTIGNLSKYKITQRFPRNRFTAASTGANGERMERTAEDVDSIALYGRFEDEVVFHDITDSELLLAHARGEVTVEPPTSYTLTPNVNAPLLFRDFDVGDFVRLRIDHGSIDLFVWVRVVEATLHVDKNGVESLSSLSVEAATSGNPTALPHEWFRNRLDEERRRLEALERRFQIIIPAAIDTPDPAPAPSAAPAPSVPSEPTAPPPPPPPAPPAPPSVSGFTATGHNYLDENSAQVRGVAVGIDVTSSLGGSVTFTVDGATVVVGFGGSGRVTAFINKGPGTYNVSATASTSAGSAGASGSATVPAVTMA